MKVLSFSKLKQLIGQNTELFKELQRRKEMMLKMMPSYGKKDKGFTITKRTI